MADALIKITSKPITLAKDGKVEKSWKVGPLLSVWSLQAYPLETESIGVPEGTVKLKVNNVQRVMKKISNTGSDTAPFEYHHYIYYEVENVGEHQVTFDMYAGRIS